jgi:hypothetical protein
MDTILYIPEKEELQEAMEAIANTKKLTLLGKVELWVSAWSHGTPKAPGLDCRLLVPGLGCV